MELKIGLSSRPALLEPMPRIEIARSNELAAGYSTEGIIRKKAFESENAIVSQSQIAPRVVAGWHHH